jgi:hypothetical protein
MTSKHYLSRDQVLRLPYVEFVPDDGRVVNLSSFYDHIACDWHLYLPVAPGQLGRIAGGETVEGHYYAVTPQDPSRDLELPLGTLITQHLSFPGPLQELAKLENDVCHCAAILEKYHLLWTSKSTLKGSATSLVESELEYLLFLLRSFYDIMQSIVSTLTRRIILPDGTGRKMVQDLPNSFADVALKGDLPRSAEQINAKWQVPESLANWYFGEAPFFGILRNLRDEIAHRGANPPMIFQHEWGFAISPMDPPWNQFDEWPVERRCDGRLGSLRALFARFISHTVQSTTRLTSAMGRAVRIPVGMLKKDVRLFIRSPFGARLVSLEAVRKQPWEGLE